MSEQEDPCVREFRKSDVDRVGRLIQHTLDVCYSSVYPPRAVQFFRDFHSNARILERHKEGEILVVELNGDVIATGAIVDRDIFGIFVHPEFQHKGYGRALMRELEIKAKSNGYDEAVLSVSLPSRGFYEGLGYREFEDRSIDVGEGEHLEFWHARKLLTGK